MLRLSQAVNTEMQYPAEIASITPERISVVIPVKDNQAGVNRFLEALFATHQPHEYPREVILVDNCSAVRLTIEVSLPKGGFPLRIVHCVRPGAAAARNEGAKNASGDWLLFCDSDCIPTGSLISGYAAADNGRAIAYAGNVKAAFPGTLSRYYDDEETLIPHCKMNKAGSATPLYIVTANALVLRSAFQEIGGFDESFSSAGGEDVDLGRRLWMIGSLAFASDSLILHDFGGGLKSFAERFVRYGRGNRRFENLTGITMRPKLRLPRRVAPFNLCAMLIQHLCLKWGYSREIDGL